MTVLNKLKGLRAERGLTQGDVAKSLNLSKATYNRKENGLGQFTTDEANIIIDMFGCSYETIFKGGTTDAK